LLKIHIHFFFEFFYGLFYPTSFSDNLEKLVSETSIEKSGSETETASSETESVARTDSETESVARTDSETETQSEVDIFDLNKVSQCHIVIYFSINNTNLFLVFQIVNESSLGDKLKNKVST
jgi:hypothetical protein